MKIGFGPDFRPDYRCIASVGARRSATPRNLKDSIWRSAGAAGLRAVVGWRRLPKRRKSYLGFTPVGGRSRWVHIELHLNALGSARAHF